MTREDFQCNRCGKCCSNGRHLWALGDEKDYANNTILRLMRDRTEIVPCEENDPCELLAFEDGVTVCLIEKHFGREFKPRGCRDFPGDRLCPCEQENKE